MSIAFGATGMSTLFGGYASDSDTEHPHGEHGPEVQVEEDRENEEGVGETEILGHRSETARGTIEVKLLQQRLKGIAHQLWPAASLLCRYVDANLDSVFSPHGGIDRCRVLELGAGVGLVGVYLSLLGCEKVILTDLPEALEILRLNISRNNAGNTASAMPLSWGNAQETESVVSVLLDRVDVDEKDGTPPLIVAADCVYWESLFDILVDTLYLVCHRTGARVLMSHIRRWKKDAKFFKLCTKKGLNVDLLSETVEHVPAEHTGIPERIVSRVYLITLKK